MAQAYTRVRKDISKLYNRPNDLQVYMYLRNECNYEKTFFKSGGFYIEKDCIVRSLDTIVKATGLTKSQVRSSICNLKNAHLITQSKVRKYSLISTACDFTSKAESHNSSQHSSHNSSHRKYNDIIK